MAKPIHRPIIRTIYLYLFAVLGLILIVIATVDFLDMALKTYIFTEADNNAYQYEKQPRAIPLSLSKVTLEENATAPKDITLTQEQINEVENWLIDYKAWKEAQKDYDPLRSSRQRDAARNIAMLLVGIPLYAYHWGIIKKETSDESRKKREKGHSGVKKA